MKVRIISSKPKSTHWYIPGGLIGCSASGQLKTSAHPVKVTCKRCLKTIADMRNDTKKGNGDGR